MTWEEEPQPQPRRHWLLAIIVMLACATAIYLWFDSLGSHPMKAPPASTAAATQPDASH